MKRWTRLLSLLLVAACSGLEEGEGGVVAVEVEIPEVSTLEVGEQVQVVAHALDVDGQVVEVPLQWQSTTAAVTVDGTGLVTGVQPGPADVQAFSGSLPSEPVSLRRSLARADTIIIAGDSVFTLPIGVEPPPIATLTVRLETFTPPGPDRLGNRSSSRSPARLRARRRWCSSPAGSRSTRSRRRMTARPAP